MPPVVIAKSTPGTAGSIANFLRDQANLAINAVNDAQADAFITDLTTISGAVIAAKAAGAAIPTLASPLPTLNVAGAGAHPTLEAVLKELMYNYKPVSIKDFVEHLTDANRVAIARGIAEELVAPAGGAVATVLKDTSVRSVVERLSGLEGLETLLKANRPASTAVFLPTLSVNPIHNLSLLLANPVIAKVVMEQRKKQSLGAYARPVMAHAFGPFGGVAPGGLDISFRGGANEALSSIDPMNYDPIEMRGAGPMLAAMRGGMGLLVGTTASPTQWRPIDDNSFISANLESAIDQLEANIVAAGATLEPAVRANVKDLIERLKTAEENVKKERNRLNTMTNAIATGTKPTGVVNSNDITAAADSYNAAMKNRQKIENKLFRVVIALGGKQLYP